jgi:transcriptional antiterminator RfaH
MPFWACARVQPQREAFAAEHLEARGFQVFLPKIETKRTVAPLFRGYAFVMIADRWRAVETSFGVLALIKFGETPARVPDREIEALKAMIDGHGFVRLPDGRGSVTKRQIAIGRR